MTTSARLKIADLVLPKVMPGFALAVLPKVLLPRFRAKLQTGFRTKFQTGFKAGFWAKPRIHVAPTFRARVRP
jgi:hypothetical protein